MQEWMKENEERMNTYLNSKGGHEASTVELLVVQFLWHQLSERNATPPQIVLSVRHGTWSKHELWWIHRDSRIICTYQLTPYPLRQPQSSNLKRLGSLRSNQGRRLQIWAHNRRTASPWTPYDLWQHRVRRKALRNMQRREVTMTMDFQLTSSEESPLRWALIEGKLSKSTIAPWVIRLYYTAQRWKCKH